VYYLFGQEYRKSKIFNRKHIRNQSIVKSINKALELSNYQLKRLEDDLLDDKIKLVKLLKSNEKSPLTLKNKVTVLKNGEEKFKALINDLKQAENHIHLEYYIFRDDHIGTEIIDILCKKASNNVTVRMS